MGLAATLLNRYLRVGRYVEQRQNWQFVRAAVQRMSEEVYEAQTVSLSSGILTLTKFSPSTLATRREATIPVVDPYDESYLVDVSYQLVDRALTRSVGDTALSVASPLESFDMILDDGLLSIDVRFRSETALLRQNFLVEGLP